MPISPPPWAGWFVGRMATRTLPADCVRDCSAPQSDVSEAVDHWLRRLNLEAPPWLLREFLRGAGGYERSELCDHRQNLRRLLFIWACDCRQNGPNYLLYLSR